MKEALFSTVMIIIAFFAIMLLVSRGGRKRERLDRAEKELEDQDEVGEIRDRLRSDPDFFERVRQRFRR